MTGITDTKTDTVFQCSFCNRTFQRENSLMVHLCEQKKRHREKSEVAVQLGLKAYLRFYEITQGSARLKSWDDFVTSAYYRAFVKFGRHCQAVKTINTAAFIDWLINKNVKLDHWCRDSVYHDYLLQHVRKENVADALSRAIESSMAWEEKTGNPHRDYLRYANDNVICHDIMSGRVTGWIIYNCASGQEFLDRINNEQIAMIWPWIDTDVWQKKFQDYPADTQYAGEILTQAGW